MFGFGAAFELRLRSSGRSRPGRISHTREPTSKLDRDSDHSYYSRIGAAFDALFEHADHDPDRPLIEFSTDARTRSTAWSR